MPELDERRNDATAPHPLIAAQSAHELGAALNAILADCFALYLKTKSFHWHVSGPNFPDYHRMLDDQAGQIFAMTDPIAERVRKLGRQTLHSIGAISRSQRVLDNDAPFVPPHEMLAELRDDNRDLVRRLREVHELADEARDIATASLIENWVDESETRYWYLFEATRK
jgi:starvation-inducible DNA-binding protein